jgi:hypothetical protein
MSWGHAPIEDNFPFRHILDAVDEFPIPIYSCVLQVMLHPEQDIQTVLNPLTSTGQQWVSFHDEHGQNSMRSRSN